MRTRRNCSFINYALNNNDEDKKQLVVICPVNSNDIPDISPPYCYLRLSLF